VARPNTVDYLQPDEQPLAEMDRHSASIIDEILFATFGLGVVVFGLLFWTLGFQPEFFMPIAVPALIVSALAYLVLLAMRWLRLTTSRYVLTDQRVYKSYGKFRFFCLQTTYDKVTDLHVKQSIWGRLGNFGTIRVETAGTGVVLEGVRNPFAFKQSVESARSAFISTLIGEHGKQTKVSDPKKTPSRESLWTGKPAPAAMLGGIISGLMLVGAGGASMLLIPLLGNQAYIMAGVLSFMGIFAISSVYVRHRYTNYIVRAGGVVVASGMLTRKRVETQYEKVTDVTTYQNILGRILGYGDITINTAGSNQAPVVFHGLNQPDHVKRIIDDARGVA
jgi:uncharacterized membrane protein YdbT with pleckstrin-like domain